MNRTSRVLTVLLVVACCFLPHASLRARQAEGDDPKVTAYKTEVVTLDAQVIEVVTEGNQYIASVRFKGLIKEEPTGQPEPFSEVWHLQKPLDGSSGWLMAGIQQDD